MRRSDGYDEVPYVLNTGEYDASEGVEVVPQEEEEDMSGFVSADSFATAGQMAVPRSTIGSYTSPPPLPRNILGYGGRQAGEHSDEES